MSCSIHCPFTDCSSLGSDCYRRYDFKESSRSDCHVDSRILSSLSAWPVYEFGQQAYDRVLSMTDEDGERWLDEHEARAEKFI